MHQNIDLYLKSKKKPDLEPLSLMGEWCWFPKQNYMAWKAVAFDRKHFKIG